MISTRELAPGLSKEDRKYWADNLRRLRRLGLVLSAKERHAMKREFEEFRRSLECQTGTPT